MTMLPNHSPEPTPIALSDQHSRAVVFISAWFTLFSLAATMCFMKISVIAIFALLLIGCESSRKSASLTPEQAKAMAIQLANDKAATLYHGQPFQDGQPARLTGGHWVWTDTRGFGHADIQATVELAADGSTNHVDLQLLDSQNQFFPGGGGRGGRGF